MKEYPTVQEVRQALQAKAEDYRRRLLDLRGQLQDEGKDAIDPGHSAGANDIKFNIACIEQLLESLPGSESVRRVVVCADPETEGEIAFAVVTNGGGGINLSAARWSVQTVGNEAPIHEQLAKGTVGSATVIGRVVFVDERKD